MVGGGKVGKVCVEEREVVKGWNVEVKGGIRSLVGRGGGEMWVGKESGEVGVVRVEDWGTEWG